jgi:hypothetical protein
MSVFVGKIDTPIPFINIDSTVFLGLAIVLSFIGMRSIAGIVWIVLFCMAVLRMVTISDAMGLWGVIYILSAFIGIYAQKKDMGMVFGELKAEFFGSATKIRSDAQSATNTIGSAINIATGNPIRAVQTPVDEKESNEIIDLKK